MNKLYMITDEGTITTIGVVANKEDIELFIQKYCNQESKDTEDFFYQVFNINNDISPSWIPCELYPISVYKGQFYYEGQTMPNGKVVS